MLRVYPVFNRQTGEIRRVLVPCKRLYITVYLRVMAVNFQIKIRHVTASNRILNDEFLASFDLYKPKSDTCSRSVCPCKLECLLINNAKLETEVAASNTSKLHTERPVNHHLFGENSADPRK